MQKKYLVKGGVVEYYLPNRVTGIAVTHGETLVKTSTEDNAIDIALERLIKKFTEHHGAIDDFDWAVLPTVTEITVERELLAAGVPSLWEGVI